MSSSPELVTVGKAVRGHRSAIGSIASVRLSETSDEIRQLFPLEVEGLVATAGEDGITIVRYWPGNKEWIRITPADASGGRPNDVRNDDLEGVSFIGAKAQDAHDFQLVIANGESIEFYRLAPDGVPLENDDHAHPWKVLNSIGEVPIDAINAFSACPSYDLLAISDDDQRIFVIPTSTTPTATLSGLPAEGLLLRPEHTNLVGTLSFSISGGNVLEVLSGGFDCGVRTYDMAPVVFPGGRPVTNGVRSRARLTVESLKKGLEAYTKGVDEAADEGAGATGGPQMFNPPFVQVIRPFRNGKYIVAALGDGTIRILHGKEVKQVMEAIAHSCTINAMEVIEDFIITGSTDRTVAIWSVTPSGMGLSAKKLKALGPPTSITRLATATLPGKVNAVHGWRQGDSLVIFAADTTGRLVEFRMPLPQ